MGDVTAIDRGATSRAACGGIVDAPDGFHIGLDGHDVTNRGAQHTSRAP